jgi:hypothetical protein
MQLPPMPEAVASHCAWLEKLQSLPASYDRQCSEGAIGSAFAAFAWVAVKETAANEIAAATAIMEIVFMFRLAETGCFPPPEHARRM